MKSIRQIVFIAPLCFAGLVVAACGPVGPGDNSSNHNINWNAQCSPGTIECQGTTQMTCDMHGVWIAEECDEACVAGQGCVPCVQGADYCLDNWVAVCDENYELVPQSECPPDTVCLFGQCVSKCDPEVLLPSNVGCEFWAVDLDNEAVDTMGMSNDAAAQQYAVVVANGNDYPVQVEVFKNDANFGLPVQESVVTTVMVPPNDLVQIDLPQREVDGCMGQNGAYVKYSGSGTFVSSHAYRVLSNGPVVAYQFNPIIQQFSNDASILIPTQALGKKYYVMGWPTANPCGAPPGDPMHMESVPDHTAVTIVGVHEGTHVTIVPTHPIMASGGDSGAVIDQTPAGTPIELDIGPYDVINLESDQPQVSIMECMSHMDQDGDLTGTLITSTLPVVVFSSHERGIGLGGAQPPDPPGWDGETCCTDHLEQQMFPVTALGWKFAISRSPVRSTDPSYQEPDIYRILATQPNTTITTTAPGFASMTLNEGEWVTFHAYEGFIIESQGGAIMVGQYLVSQGYIPQGGIGDPTQIIFPAAEQHRDHYVFLVPTTFEKNYMVLAKPQTATIELDDAPLGEFNPDCEIGPIGTLDGVVYEQLTCRLDEGTHRVAADEPFGLSVYGYYNVGSYGYPGGSDVKIINPVD